MPGEIAPRGTEDTNAAIEESHTPHLDCEEAREKAEADIRMEGEQLDMR